MSQLENFFGSKESVSQNSEIPFDMELSELKSSVGNVLQPLPDPLTEAKLLKLNEDNVKDKKFDSFNEMFRNNELVYKISALQREAVIRNKINNGKEISDREMAELIVTNQAASYHEYYLQVVNHVVNVMSNYKELRETIPSIPPEIEQGEIMAKLYLNALRFAIDDRVEFANQVLQHGIVDKNTWIKGYELNQMIINILSGKHNISGVEKGFIPQKLYIELLKYKYEQLLERQKEIAADTSLANAYSRRDQLKLKHDLAKEGKGEFTKADEEEYNSLLRQIRDKDKELNKVGQQRHFITQQLIKLMGVLGENHITLTKIARIQNQFGNNIDFTDASRPLGGQTPEAIKKAFENSMETRSNFQMDSMNAMLNVMQKDVLNVRFMDHIEDKFNKKGHEIIHNISNLIANSFTGSLTETFGIEQLAHEYLTEQLDDALGWPRGKDNWSDLTPDEKQHIMEKTKSIIDVINNFDKSKIVNLQKTMIMIKQLRPASEFAGQDVIMPLPKKRVTMENIETLKKQYGTPTLYMMLLHQMETDFGGTDPDSGFLGEYKKYLSGINDVIDVHIDVGFALHTIKEKYKDLSDALRMIAIIALGATAVMSAGVMYVTYRIGKKVVTIMIKQGSKLTVKTISRLGKLINQIIKSKPVIPKIPLKLPSGELGKILGPAIIIITGYEVLKAIDFERNLLELDERQSVDAALELMKTHPAVNKSVHRYKREIESLKTRQNLITIREVLSVLLGKIEQIKDTNDGLKKEKIELIKKIKFVIGYTNTLDNQMYWYFPVTDAIKINKKDPKGVLRVDYSKFNRAREEGIENMMNPLKEPDFKHGYKNIKNEYIKLLDEIKSFLDKTEIQ